MAKPTIKSDGKTITVRVPISIRKRGGRKVVLAPHGAMHDPRKLFCQQIDNAMVKAIARGFRWREMLEGGSHATIREIAAAESINVSYVSRVLRLTLLAPDIIESLIRGHHAAAITLATLMRPFPSTWEAQVKVLRLRI